MKLLFSTFSERWTYGRSQRSRDFRWKRSEKFLRRSRVLTLNPDGINESDQTIYVVPDVYVVKTEDGFDVLLNDDGIPDN